MKSRTALFLLPLSLIALLALPVAGWAQETTKPAATPTADPNQIRQYLYDLTLLRPLQTVNFSEDQIKDLTKIVKEVLEADKARRKKDDDAVREIADAVKEARTGALNGVPISKDVETKIADMQKAVVARIGIAKREAVEKILTVLWPTLSDTQKDAMDKFSIVIYGGKRVPAAYRDNPKKAPREEVLKLSAGAFIENVLLDDRVPQLLESLKPLAPDTSTSKP